MSEKQPTVSEVVDTYGCAQHGGNGPSDYMINGSSVLIRCSCRYVRPARKGDSDGNLARFEMIRSVPGAA